MPGDIDEPLTDSGDALVLDAIASDTRPALDGMSEDDVLEQLVPAAFLVVGHEREDGVLRAHSFETLRGQLVVVDAAGFLYRGLLVGADEEELYLRGETRWWVLPLATVREMHVAPPEVPLGGEKPGFEDPLEAIAREHASMTTVTGTLDMPVFDDWALGPIDMPTVSALVLEERSGNEPNAALDDDDTR